jgi:hypothetical protein
MQQIYLLLDHKQEHQIDKNYIFDLPQAWPFLLPFDKF